MKTTIFLFSLFVITLLTSNCYSEMTGTVVDAETAEPIEGAVVLVEWTIEKGLPGLAYTKPYKVIEAVTNKDGKVKISGVFNPLVNPPSITIYKKGYVAWNNKFIFPDYKKRFDKWHNNYVVKMDRFKSEYTYEAHVAFIRSTYSFGLGANSEFEKAWYWEDLRAHEEIQIKKKTK